MREFLIVAGIHLLGVMSPGPDFAMVVRNSLVYSRRTGVLAAMGLGLGILVHVSYSILGIALIISKSILLFNTIRLAGAAYLIYIGAKSLLSRSKPAAAEEAIETKPDLSTGAAIRMGFLTNVLNPKATLFFLALFTQVISPHTSNAIKALYGLEMSTATFAWFTFVAVLLSHGHIKKAFARVQHHFEKVFGAVLVAIGVTVALSARH